MTKQSNKSALANVANTQAALDGIDRVFHEKARLGIMTTIVASDDGMSFIELKELCNLTDGNLNRHLKVLVDTGVLRVKKSGQGRHTNSHYRMTAKGRKAFECYLVALETILDAARSTIKRPVTENKNRETDDGLSAVFG